MSVSALDIGLLPKVGRSQSPSREHVLRCLLHCHTSCGRCSLSDRGKVRVSHSFLSCQSILHVGTAHLQQHLGHLITQKAPNGSYTLCETKSFTQYVHWSNAPLLWSISASTAHMQANLTTAISAECLYGKRSSSKNTTHPSWWDKTPDEATLLSPLANMHCGAWCVSNSNNMVPWKLISPDDHTWEACQGSPCLQESPGGHSLHW